MKIITSPVPFPRVAIKLKNRSRPVPHNIQPFPTVPVPRCVALAERNMQRQVSGRGPAVDRPT